MSKIQPKVRLIEDADQSFIVYLLLINPYEEVQNQLIASKRGMMSIGFLQLHLLGILKPSSVNMKITNCF